MRSWFSRFLALGLASGFVCASGCDKFDSEASKADRVVKSKLDEATAKYVKAISERAQSRNHEAQASSARQLAHVLSNPNKLPKADFEKQKAEIAKQMPQEGSVDLDADAQTTAAQQFEEQAKQESELAERDQADADRLLGEASGAADASSLVRSQGLYLLAADNYEAANIAVRQALPLVAEAQRSIAELHYLLNFIRANRLAIQAMRSLDPAIELSMPDLKDKSYSDALANRTKDADAAIAAVQAQIDAFVKENTAIMAEFAELTDAEKAANGKPVEILEARYTAARKQEEELDKRLSTETGAAATKTFAEARQAELLSSLASIKLEQCKQILTMMDRHVAILKGQIDLLNGLKQNLAKRSSDTKNDWDAIQRAIKDRERAIQSAIDRQGSPAPGEPETTLAAVSERLSKTLEEIEARRGTAREKLEKTESTFGQSVTESNKAMSEITKATENSDASWSRDLKKLKEMAQPYAAWLGIAQVHESMGELEAADYYLLISVQQLFARLREKEVALPASALKVKDPAGASAGKLAEATKYFDLALKPKEEGAPVPAVNTVEHIMKSNTDRDGIRASAALIRVFALYNKYLLAKTSDSRSAEAILNMARHALWQLGPNGEPNNSDNPRLAQFMDVGTALPRDLLEVRPTVTTLPTSRPATMPTTVPSTAPTR